MSDVVEPERGPGPRVEDPWFAASLRIAWVFAVDLEVGTESFVLHDAVPGMLGWTRRDLALVPADQLIHPDDRELIPGGVSCAGRDPIRFLPIELRILSWDSRYWWTRWYLRRRREGAIVATADCLLGPDSDVGPAVGVWEWDRDADTVAWSVELLDMFGFRAQPPATYVRALGVVWPEDRPCVTRHVERAMACGDPFVVTFRSAAPGRRDRWFQASGRRFDQDGCRRLGGLAKDLNPACTPVRGRVIGSG